MKLAGLIQGILTKIFPPEPEPINGLRDGAICTVRGAVVARDLMDSPITGTSCVYYQYTVESWRKSQVLGVGGDGFWERIESDEVILEFYVEDATGRAIVTPAHSRVISNRKIAASELELGDHRRARELVLAPGDAIEVTGEAVLVPDLYDDGRGYRASPTRFMLRAPADHELFIRVLERRPACPTE